MNRLVINNNRENSIEFTDFTQTLHRVDIDGIKTLISEIQFEVSPKDYTIDDFRYLFDEKIERISLINDDDIEYEAFSEYTEVSQIFRNSGSEKKPFVVTFR